MNIIHITCISNNKASGIAAIVPYHIRWQSKYANIFWYNISSEYMPPHDLSKLYCGTREIPNFNIDLLSHPFSTPDMVVFHGVFFYTYHKIARQLVKLEIPYVVVPHGSLTESAVKQKALKKYLGFKVLFGRFIKNAKAIQYLTLGERESSGEKWNEHSIIIPNGCEIPGEQKMNFRHNDLSGVFIGRKSIYYKGLDLLLEASNIIKDQLEDNNCRINIYGPDEEGSNEILHKIIEKYGLSKYIKLHDSVFNEDKINVLMNSDFFILTSRTEGHPVALIEALSYGIPCLVTTGTNMADEILNNNAGWVAEDNTKSIAHALTKVLSDIDQFNIKGKNAYILSLNYEWSIVAQNAISSYKRLCEF